MRCVICKHGQTGPAQVNLALDLPDGGTVVFQNVPAEVCDTCGERYFDEATTGRVLRQAEQVEAHGTEVQVRLFAA